MISNSPLGKKGNRVWTVSTEPTVEPVTLAEVKTFARIDGSDEDTLIGEFITDIRKRTEDYLNRALLQQTITMKMDYWPGEVIQLPRPPLISVTGVYTTDEDDADTEYSSSNYYVITEAVPGELVLKYGVTAPENTNRYHRGYKIIYVAGYGTTATDVPKVIKDAILIWITELFETRVPTDEPPIMVRNKLRSFRLTPHVFSR